MFVVLLLTPAVPVYLTLHIGRDHIAMDISHTSKWYLESNVLYTLVFCCGTSCKHAFVSIGRGCYYFAASVYLFGEITWGFIVSVRNAISFTPDTHIQRDYREQLC